MYKKVTNGGYSFYIHTYSQGSSHIPHSTWLFGEGGRLCHPPPHFHILPCYLAMTAKQHGRIWKWIQKNLEIYRNLKGTIYTSPVQKEITGFQWKNLF